MKRKNKNKEPSTVASLPETRSRSTRTVCRPRCRHFSSRTWKVPAAGSGLFPVTWNLSLRSVWMFTHQRLLCSEPRKQIYIHHNMFDRVTQVAQTSLSEQRSRSLLPLASFAAVKCGLTVKTVKATFCNTQTKRTRQLANES